MKKLKTIIIDDERLAREELKSVLSKFDTIKIVGEAENGEEGIEKIESLAPDLIFLDVSMPEMTGFEMLKKLGEIPHVIFVTAYDEYAVEAFKVNAMDYIVKPVEDERVEEAVVKVLKSEEQEFESKEIKTLRKEKMLGFEDKIFLKDGEKCYFTSLKEVHLLESDGNYVKVYFKDSRAMVLSTLNNFEGKLNPEEFFRANRKSIFNTSFVKCVENWFNGGLRVTLTTGEKIEISRRQAHRFRELFGF